MADRHIARTANEEALIRGVRCCWCLIRIMPYPSMLSQYHRCTYMHTNTVLYVQVHPSDMLPLISPVNHPQKSPSFFLPNPDRPCLDGSNHPILSSFLRLISSVYFQASIPGFLTFACCFLPDIPSCARESFVTAESNLLNRRTDILVENNLFLATPQLCSWYLLISSSILLAASIRLRGCRLPWIPPPASSLMAQLKLTRISINPPFIAQSKTAREPKMPRTKSRKEIQPPPAPRPKMKNN